MKRIVCFIFIWFFVGVSLAQERIVVSGTGDSQELLRLLAADFEKANPGTKIEVSKSIGSSGAIRATAEGRCDLGRVVRPIKEKEKAYNLNYQVFAYSPLVFAVNPNVKGIDNLSFEQLVGIFSGKITFWSELGGAKQKIFVAQRETDDSSRLVLEKVIPGWKEIKNLAGEVIYSTPELVSTVAKYENTIGYTPLGMAKEKGLIVLKINGACPSVENIKNAKYELVVPFALVWKGELKGSSRAFVDYILSPAGQKIVAENGAAPVK